MLVNVSGVGIRSAVLIHIGSNNTLDSYVETVDITSETIVVISSQLMISVILNSEFVIKIFFGDLHYKLKMNESMLKAIEKEKERKQPPLPVPVSKKRL